MGAGWRLLTECFIMWWCSGLLSPSVSAQYYTTNGDFLPNKNNWAGWSSRCSRCGDGSCLLIILDVQPCKYRSWYSPLPWLQGSNICKVLQIRRERKKTGIFIEFLVCIPRRIFCVGAILPIIRLVLRSVSMNDALEMIDRGITLEPSQTRGGLQ